MQAMISFGRFIKKATILFFFKISLSIKVRKQCWTKWKVFLKYFSFFMMQTNDLFTTPLMDTWLSGSQRIVGILCLICDYRYTTFFANVTNNSADQCHSYQRNEICSVSMHLPLCLCAKQWSVSPGTVFLKVFRNMFPGR